MKSTGKSICTLRSQCAKTGRNRNVFSSRCRWKYPSLICSADEILLEDLDCTAAVRKFLSSSD